MKKKFKFILLSLVLGVLILGVTGCGKSGKDYYAKYQHLNFKEVLEAEKFELANTNYEESDEQAVIYLFRGQGCGFCRNFISFLNSISEEYGKYFKLVSFEVWNDADNADLMSKVADITGVEARGVPYIIIGDKVFDGYIDSYDQDIKDKIMSQYKDASYDVFDELAKSESGFKGFSNSAVILINLLAVVLGVVFVCLYSNKNKQEIIDTINKINTKKLKNEEEKK